MSEPAYAPDPRPFRRCTNAVGMIWRVDGGWNKSVPPRIFKAERPRSRNLIYVSAGDRETFGSYAIDRLTDYFDVAIFYYGRSAMRKTRLQEGATLFSVGRGAKFNSLRQLLSLIPGLFEAYETVWVCDDDVVPIAGDFRMVVDMLRTFNLQVIWIVGLRRGVDRWRTRHAAAARWIRRRPCAPAMYRCRIGALCHDDRRDSHDGASGRQIRFCPHAPIAPDRGAEFATHEGGEHCGEVLRRSRPLGSAGVIRRRQSAVRR